MSIYGKLYNCDSYLVIANEISNKFNNGLISRMENTIENGKIKNDNTNNGKVNNDEVINVIVFNSNDIPVSIGSLISVDNQYFINNVITEDCNDKDEYEELAVRMLVNKAFKLGAIEILGEIQNEKRTLYKKIGFLEIDGESLYNNSNYCKVKIVSTGFYKEC
jgi:hypothetical protein